MVRAAYSNINASGVIFKESFIVYGIIMLTDI